MADFNEVSHTETPRLEDSFVSNPSGVQTRTLNQVFAEDLGWQPTGDERASVIRTSKEHTAAELVEKLREANIDWVLASLADVPLDLKRSETHKVAHQQVAESELSPRTQKREKAASKLALALQLRRDDEKHPSFFGRRKAK